MWKSMQRGFFDAAAQKGPVPPPAAAPSSARPAPRGGKKPG
jgi:hypothetical protein